MGATALQCNSCHSEQCHSVCASEAREDALKFTSLAALEDQVTPLSSPRSITLQTGAQNVLRKPALKPDLLKQMQLEDKFAREARVTNKLSQSPLSPAAAETREKDGSISKEKHEAEIALAQKMVEVAYTKTQALLAQAEMRVQCAEACVNANGNVPAPKHRAVVDELETTKRRLEAVEAKARELESKLTSCQGHEHVEEDLRSTKQRLSEAEDKLLHAESLGLT